MVLVIQLDLPACIDNVLNAAHYLNCDDTNSDAKHLPIKRHENVTTSPALKHCCYFDIRLTIYREHWERLV